ncbi:MAG TPA: NDP-sugar synthase [Dehalococcoidales bacterium]|nr:NDP-sugar synthase [Dehalococcoidales bacterium]
MAGGPGTRLQPLTSTTPKSMVPVLNRPFMEHTIAYLKQFGIRDIILTLSYLPGVIREYFRDGSPCGVRLTYCLEAVPLGTAGAVKNAEAHLDGTFFVLNGDVFTDLDLADMFARHREKGAKASISLHRVEDPSAFGVVETDSHRRVKAFIEKPPRAEATTDWINAGTYILEPEVMRHIPPGHYMFERGLFPTLLGRGEPVYGYPHRGYWLDMGTPGKYFSLCMDLLTAAVRSPLLPGLDGGLSYGPRVNVHPSASVTGPVVAGGGCRIDARVSVVGPVVLGENCRLEEGVFVKNAILWDNVSVGTGARLNRAIISSNAGIAPGQEVADRMVTPGETAPLPR